MTAIRDGDRAAFFAAFDPAAGLTDDGSPQPLAEWAEREIFASHGRLQVELEEQDGLLLFGPFHSDRVGEFPTSWRFRVAEGRVVHLDVRAT